MILHKKSSQCALKFDLNSNVKIFFIRSPTLEVITRKLLEVYFLKVKNLNSSSSCLPQVKQLVDFNCDSNIKRQV